ncbi:fungal cellulose binding domain protein [Aspergillus clavatus NRRL 1]|uniref:Feruloyl esterase C n=1 Tax=Aspergillus clavatus (strain ATCC 1007 / CBS 513.65 / DSM 816 / NCTC 3887 / NRRL 1 / QM 1276 / 107) TaxID=344612 RepID=A1CCD3_ASPCL|nr:fungal cellulose binding domain protein [Aspergillus clavatus NRRL 1]EAW12190.1 fungal cellulose binding domain protein [Aspergillus clavatus NRRL 1]
MKSIANTKGVVLLALALPVLGQQSLYGQCGGNGWSGPTECTAGACCQVQNPWYSQCLPGDCKPSSPTTTLVTSTTASTTTVTAPGGHSTGCGKTPSMNSGTYTMTVNGIQRQYTLTLPQNYDRSKPYKLIFGYHWLGGTMQNVAGGAYYGVQPLSGNSAIFVAPQGLDNGWANKNGDDITFNDQLVAKLTTEFCIDDSQIYSMGWSYGGSMSYALACARPDVFRGVAVMSGANLSGCSPGTKPVGYYGQHGGSDDVLSISLGRQIRDTFVKDNQCTPQNPSEPAKGSGKHIKTVYSGCSTDHPVWWIAFDGPHEPLATDAGSSSSWTPGELWSFISQFN